MDNAIRVIISYWECIGGISITELGVAFWIRLFAAFIFESVADMVH